MLSYQHIYHAGNIVDCQKHTILAALLNLLNQEEASYCYIDTHSGRGLYDLTSSETQKLQEYKSGIEKIWTKKWPSEIRSLKDLIDNLNPRADIKVYPGSPYIAQAHAREQDALELYEIHPQELTALDQTMGKMENVKIYNMDGWQVLDEYLPPDEKRGVVLVDPSYEVKEEYDSMAEHLQAAIEQRPDGIYMIWYPLLAAGRHLTMLQQIKNSGIKNILQNEIEIDSEKGLQGTGVLLVNPPLGFEHTVSKITDWLAASLGGRSKTHYLVNAEPQSFEVASFG